MTDKDFSSLSEQEWALCDQRGDFFSRILGLPVSLWITRRFLQLNLSENHASAAMLVTGLLGALLMLLGSWGVLFGCLMLLLHHILDYVDGQLARHHGRASIRGAVLDRWNHFVVEFVTFPCLALGLYLQSGQIWLILVVWLLYGWNRFRILLAQLPANILADELSSYPEFEQRMMRANLTPLKAATAQHEAHATPDSGTRPGRPAASLRTWLSRARPASTSFNGFTLLLGAAALTDLAARLTFSVNGSLEVLVCIIAAYYLVNFVDYSWTYLRTDRIERDIRSRQ